MVSTPKDRCVLSKATRCSGLDLFRRMPHGVRNRGRSNPSLPTLHRRPGGCNWKLQNLQVRRQRRSSLHNVRPGLLASLSMDESKLSSALVFFVGNYFVTFFIIGLIAAGISLLNKSKPLRIGKVSEAFLSSICFSRLE